MRGAVLSLAAALAWPVAANAQSVEIRDWQLVCDNARTCRAAGYSVAGSELPASLLIARAAGPHAPVYAELQLAERGPHPASVSLGTGKSAVAVRLDKANHADLPPAAVLALLKTLPAGSDAVFASGKSTWRVSAAGAAEALQQMDELQGRSGRPSALVRKGGGSDADVASAMAVPRMDATRISAQQQPDDAALAVRVLAAIQSKADCPLLDDGNAQSQGRLWHLDANRLLVTQPCSAGANGWWIANRRPPYDARPLTYAGEFDGVATVVARVPGGSAGDCGTVEAWTWNGYRFEQTRAASGGLCRGVKAGGAWELPTLVTEVIPTN